MGRVFNHFILSGYKSCGKSYFGKKLSDELGLCFIDTDLLIAKDGKIKEKMVSLGEEKFRKLESFVIKSLYLSKRSVIATGGGTLLLEKNLQVLKTYGSIIYLKSDKSLIKENIFKGGVPAFLDEKDIDGSFERMYEERKAIFENSADFTVSIANRDDELILNDLKAIFNWNQ